MVSLSSKPRRYSLMRDCCPSLTRSTAREKNDGSASAGTSPRGSWLFATRIEKYQGGARLSVSFQHGRGLDAKARTTRNENHEKGIRFFESGAWKVLQERGETASSNISRREATESS